MTDVMKMNDETQQMNPDKIRSSIAKAAREAGYDEDKTKKVVETVGNTAISSLQSKEKIETSEIRTMILDRLDERFPDVAAAWREYDEKNKTAH